MATPTTKATLKQYCLRALGQPVIEINVDDDQCDDRVEEALQYFQEVKQTILLQLQQMIKMVQQLLIG